MLYRTLGIILFLIFSIHTMAQQTKLPDFDTLWNYAQPDSTELIFREILSEVSREEHPEYYLELQTQIARTLGLQQKYDEAQVVLNEVFFTVNKTKFPVVLIRYYLEKGRVINSSGFPEKAKADFLQAYTLAVQEKQDYYTIDAAHMLGIVEKGEKSIEWNLKAIEMAENTTDQRAGKWQGTLLNNMGWTYFDMEEYDMAKTVFEKTYNYYTQQNSMRGADIAKWSIAKCLRYQNEPEKALQIHLTKAETDSSGYTWEEMAECYYLLGNSDQAALYFKKAYDILSKDIWLQQNEPERIERMKKLSNQ